MSHGHASHSSFTGRLNSKNRHGISSFVKVHRSHRAVNTKDASSVPQPEEPNVPARSVVIKPFGETHKLNMRQQAEQRQAGQESRTKILKSKHV